MRFSQENTLGVISTSMKDNPVEFLMRCLGSTELDSHKVEEKP